MKVSLLLTCAGKGTRAEQQKNKLLVPINGETVLQKALNCFIKCDKISEIVLTANKDDFDLIKKAYPDYKVVLGGKTRTESIYNGLKEITGDVVLISDGARPFISEKLILECIESAEKYGSAIPVLPERNTLIKGDGKVIDSYIGKDGYYEVQTPQGFKTELILSAYEYIKGKTFNDDGEVYKNLFGSVYSFLGDTKNVKITYKEDFELLKSFNGVRFGTGFDCHKLAENRKLVLGGVIIPHDKGLLGHSDADVLIHAVMDAMLSACSLRDIGYYFPDNDEKYKNIDSTILLKKVLDMVKEKGFIVGSVSAVIMAQKPKLLNFIPKITENLSMLLDIAKDSIGISATTLEGLGFIGREEGICVYANAVLLKSEK